MAGILVLVFFDNRLKAILTTNLYERAFTFFAVVAITGILLTTTIGFTTHQGNNQQALVDNTTFNP